MTHARWQRLFEIARTQAGVVTLRDVAAAGLPGTTFRDRARREGWQRLFPGTWLIPGSPASH
ncbi:MAG TPA: type IV toxin-antitoxin system AbiEi family antitoxin domain-containing protein, partial [Nitriliruptoraceae bacterium]|nr:type IV toxin-antitoxin system AbiEi family antitoxin domain-containing protein [Nitriliruptoraceae bacterium]